jgi:hypothetical protein
MDPDHRKSDSVYEFAYLDEEPLGNMQPRYYRLKLGRET